MDFLFNKKDTYVQRSLQPDNTENYSYQTDVETHSYSLSVDHVKFDSSTCFKIKFDSLLCQIEKAKIDFAKQAVANEQFESGLNELEEFLKKASQTLETTNRLAVADVAALNKHIDADKVRKSFPCAVLRIY